MLRIGISPCYFHADPKRPIFKGKTLLYLEQSLSQWIMSQKNVLAYMLPEVDGDLDFVSDLDGLVLQGGSDVCPQSYGQEPLKVEWSGDLKRDQHEIKLIKAFISAGKPILGICRGLQIINVALGGTLYQDIQTQHKTEVRHRDWDLYDQLFHPIKFKEASRLKELYQGTSEAKVNTVHHQGIEKLGKNLLAEAVSEEDGMIEAVRLDSKSYVFGVQWHPEFMSKDDPSLLNGTPLLVDFLSAAQKTRFT